MCIIYYTQQLNQLSLLISAGNTAGQIVKQNTYKPVYLVITC